MLKRSVTYEDFNGDTQTEEFYFNLSKAELIEMEVDIEGGMGAYLRRIIEEKDHRNLVKYFKKIVLEAYGQKSPDGKRFVKSDEMREEFSQSAAYSTLFMELASDDRKAAEFIKGVLPADMQTDDTTAAATT